MAMAEKPDYEGLIRFLMAPFLDVPSEFKTDCEQPSANDKVWLRVAFSQEDRGRMFGRGGRNIQAIRTVLRSTAALHGKRLSLDIYGESSSQGRPGNGGMSSDGADGRRRRRPERPHRNR